MMEKYLIIDFNRAKEIALDVSSLRVSKEEATVALRNVIFDHIYCDIKTLSEEAYNILQTKSKELSKINDDKKKAINEKTRVDDDIDERQLKLRLLDSDYMRWLRELQLIQELIDRKGWFNVE